MTIVLELDADNCTGAKVLTIVLEQGMYTCTEVDALRHQHIDQRLTPKLNADNCLQVDSDSCTNC